MKTISCPQLLLPVFRKGWKILFPARTEIDMPTPETPHQWLRITFIFPPHRAVRTVRLILSHITFFVSLRLMSLSSALAMQVSHLFFLRLMSRSVDVNVGSGERQNGGLHKTHFPHYAFANIANFLIIRTCILLQRVSKRPDEPPQYPPDYTGE